MSVVVTVADASHVKYASIICQMMEDAAKVRGTGIAKRKPEYICTKMEQSNSVIALDNDEVIGFCYIEHWENKKFVANSGLIVHPDYRKTGLAKQIKGEILKLSNAKYPTAKLFGITTSLAVMKINTDLGYKPVTFSELTTDEVFWAGCKSCKNHDILERTERKMCLCTGMIYSNPDVQVKVEEKKENSSFINPIDAKGTQI